MALLEKKDNLIPISPVVTSRVCFMCQNSAQESVQIVGEKHQRELNKNLKKYLNVNVSGGSLCKSCQRKLDIVVSKVDGLRDGVLVDKAESHSSGNLNKWLSAVFGASEKSRCVLTWSNPDETVHQGLYDLQREGDFCNVNLIDSRGLTLLAHACVLAAGSPVLKSALMLEQSHGWLKKEGLSVKVAGISQQEWRIITEYLYLGRVTIVMNPGLIKRVHHAARMLKITSLATLIWRKVESLRLKVDLSGEVGKVKMKLAGCNVSEQQQHSELLSTSADSYSQQGEICPVLQNLIDGHDEAGDSTGGSGVTAGDVDTAHDACNIEETFQMVKLENLWQAEGGGSVDSIQEELRRLKEDGDWSGMECPSPQESRASLHRNLTCKFCDEAFTKKVELIEHIARHCSKLSRTGEVGEHLFDALLDDTASPTIKGPKKRGRKPKTLDPSQRVAKPKPSYVCFNDECRTTFKVHNQYMTHLRQCVLKDDIIDHQKHMRIIDDMLIYDNMSDMLDNNGTDTTCKIRPYAVLCSNGVDINLGEKIYKCAQCHAKGVQDTMISHLVLAHTKPKSFSCRKCPSKYGYFGSFKDHYVSSHTSHTYICPQENCKQVFAKKDSLNRHILMDHKRQGKQLFLCKGCGKTFKLAHHARRHEMYHRKEDRQHVCPLCYKTFATKQDLQRHSFIHSGVKPYKCSQCVYSAARKFNLILHERKHGVIHGQYSCHICGKHFITQVNLKSHIERHEKPDVQKSHNAIRKQKVQEDVGETHSVSLDTSLTTLSSQDATMSEFPSVAKTDVMKSSDRVNELEVLETVQNSQQSLPDQAGTSNLVYILTTGQPYDYAFVDTSMLNTSG